MGPQSGQIINHQQLQGIVTVAPDGKTAKARWTAFVMGGSPYAAVQWGDVTYENDYIKEERGMEALPAARAVHHVFAVCGGLAQDRRYPTRGRIVFRHRRIFRRRVIYLTFPSFYLEPFHYPNPVTGKAAPPPNRAAGGLAPMSDYPTEFELPWRPFGWALWSK